MSFVTQEDVFATVQPVIRGCFEEFGKGRRWMPTGRAFPIAKLLWYGSDKPDLRNPIKMQVVSEHFAGSGFAIFAKLLEQPGTEIRAIPAPGRRQPQVLRPDERLCPGAGAAGDGVYLLARGRRLWQRETMEAAGPLTRMAKNIGAQSGPRHPELRTGATGP
jgi:aspartyl-tRNA synthetase